MIKIDIWIEVNCEFQFEFEPFRIHLANLNTPFLPPQVTPEITAQTKKLLQLMGVAIVNAPCEAEATCAELAKAGLCHAAATEDADALTFGANILVRNIFSTDLKKRPMFEVNLSRCLEQLDVDMETFIDFCILSGCDYTNTIKGVGSKTAFQVRNSMWMELKKI